MPIPRIIHFTVPKNPSESHRRCIEEARALHPDWDVRVWQDPIDPTGMRLGKYWPKVNSGAQLADLVRLDVVRQFGGFYLDSDFSMKRRLDPLCHFDFVGCSENGRVLTNAFFGASADSPAMEQLVRELEQNEVDWKLPPDQTTGPMLFTRELKWRTDITVLPRETFYPYNWNEAAAPPRKWTYGVHLWDHSWGHTTKMSFPRRVMKRGPIVAARWVRTAAREGLQALGRVNTVNHPKPYPASGVVCAQTIHGPKILLVGDDMTVTPSIALSGSYEYREEKFALRVVRPGDWVIDVGANVGMLTLLFAKRVGPFGRVYAYEPNPLPAGLLRKSLVMNWMHDRVYVRERALGSQPSRLKLRFSREALGGATLVGKGSAGTFERTSSLLSVENEVEVEVGTLDGDFPADVAIRLLKIDAEGFEHHVLAGGKRLLESVCPEIIMLECVREVYGADWPLFLDAIRQLTQSGYRTYLLNRRARLVPTTLEAMLASRVDRNLFLVADHARPTIAELRSSPHDS